MTRAQTELLVAIAIGVRSLVYPDQMRVIQKALDGLKADEPLSAWENYRPDDLTDDELAEYVSQSKGAVIL